MQWRMMDKSSHHACVIRGLLRQHVMLHLLVIAALSRYYTCFTDARDRFPFTER
jgi:fucose permease